MASNLHATKYVFGSDSGTESTHALLTENTPYNIASANTMLIRLAIKESGTGTNNLTCTWQYNQNGAGWNNITTTSSVVKAVTPTCWANGADCTNRTSETGVFITNNDGCTADGTSGGTSNDFANAGDFTETELAFQFVAADVTDRDTIQLRVTGSSTVTMDVTPEFYIWKEFGIKLLTGGYPRNTDRILIFAQGGWRYIRSIKIKVLGAWKSVTERG